MDGNAMTHAGRPLHRLTPLTDDPVRAWLSPAQVLRVAITGWIRWAAFGVFWLFLWFACLWLLPGLIIPTVAALMAGGALVWPTRRMILRARAQTAADMIGGSAPAGAVLLDALAELERQPDGTLVSVVGWIRARNHLPQPVGGETCIGLALACHQRYPGVLETLCDFELVDEAGATTLVQVADGRMLGDSNVNLTDANARRLLVASLDLPVGAVATGWDALVLRDGDPVMVVGFKQTAFDPAQSSLRAPPARSAVASLAPKPILIFPIAGERRPQTGAPMVNLS